MLFTQHLYPVLRSSQLEELEPCRHKLKLLPKRCVVCVYACRCVCECVESESCACDRWDTADKVTRGWSSQRVHRYRVARSFLSIPVRVFCVRVCISCCAVVHGIVCSEADASLGVKPKRCVCECMCVCLKEGNGWLYTPSDPAGQHKSSSVSPRAD